MSARVFPSSEAGQYTMRAAALRSLNTLQKKKRAGSAGSFLSPAMANTIVTTDTEVKHKTGLCHTNVLPSKLQGIKKKTKQTPPPEKLPTPAVKYSNNIL